ARKTSAPPTTTCTRLRPHGVSMYRCRIQAISTSSTSTTATAIQVATRMSGIRYGSVWPSPPAAVITPHTNPRVVGRPRPVRLPSSDSASANPMLIPAPDCGGEADQKRLPTFVSRECGREERRQSRDRAVHEPGQPGLNDLEDKQPPPGGRVVFRL